MTQAEIEVGTIKVITEISKMVEAIGHLVEKAEKETLRTNLLNLDKRADTTNKSESSTEIYNTLVGQLQADIDAVKNKVNKFLDDENATKVKEELLLNEVAEIQTQLDRYAKLLADRVNKQNLNVALKNLEKALQVPEGLENKTEDSRKKYEKVKEEALKIQTRAQAIYSDANATKQQVEDVTEEVITVTESLAIAKMQLEEKVNKEELQKQIILAKEKK